MNRRTFLQALFSAGVALAAAPTLLSLVPTPAPAPCIFEFSATELALTDELLERYLRPAAAAMAQDLEDRCAMYAYQAFGTPLERAA